jgi:hypothetical protein
MNEQLFACFYLLMDPHRLQTDYEAETHSYGSEPLAGLLLC